MKQLFAFATPRQRIFLAVCLLAALAVIAADVHLAGAQAGAPDPTAGPSSAPTVHDRRYIIVAIVILAALAIGAWTLRDLNAAPEQ